MTHALRGTLDLSTGRVSTLWLRPEGATHALVFAHGAGTALDHPILESFALALASRDVATLRYNFPYMERRGGGPPDRPPRLVDTVAAAVELATDLAGELPLFAGGRSMGARMTSTALSEGRLPERVRGLVFHAFPLHRPGHPSIERAEHLDRVAVPLLFLQGERDRMATPEVLGPLLDRLGDRARLHAVPQADHQFRVPRRAGRSAEEITADLANATAAFVREVAS